LLPELNSGQIYSTLSRLERDRLVESKPVHDDNRDKKVYRLTGRGRDLVERWVGAPVSGTRLKDEFFVKLVVATSVGLADPNDLIERQRDECLQSLGDLDARMASRAHGPTAQLLVEGAVLHLKADLEWLDLIEAQLARRSA
jgi:DNA-binding PadR family transcriptional regulator